MYYLDTILGCCFVSFFVFHVIKHLYFCQKLKILFFFRVIKLYFIERLVKFHNVNLKNNDIKLKCSQFGWKWSDNFEHVPSSDTVLLNKCGETFDFVFVLFSNYVLYYILVIVQRFVSSFLKNLKQNFQKCLTVFLFDRSLSDTCWWLLLANL